MEKIKGIPYGKANFSDVVDQNYYYVDKTMYLPLMEQKASYIFMIRPRRFGKSMFISMMHAYYDMNQQDKYQARFGDLWIGQHPTELQGKFQVLYFDFSLASSKFDTLEETFNTYCCIQLDGFMDKYKSSYSEREVNAFYNSTSARAKLNLLNTAARNAGIRLYLIVDEYDNFTNVVLSEKGKETYKNLTHASGFYRDYFKIFKASFDRIFLIGVSPITLDDLSSGYNIDWGISTEPEFNAMLGFSEAEVRGMFAYYQEVGQLKGSIDEMIEEMRPWYDNYCFARACLDDDKLFNCDMVLYYLQHRIAYNNAPEDMVDKNIRTDYKKLKMNHGYSDIFLIADRKKYSDIAHSYLLELKYAKQGASEAEVAKLRTDAMEQLERYSDDRLLTAACAGTQLHRLVVVFRGFEMVVCEDI